MPGRWWKPWTQKTGDVEEAQIILHEADKPDLVVDLLDAGLLAGEDRAEVNLLASELAWS